MTGLLEAGYRGLFQSGDRTAIDAAWRDGAGREELLETVRSGPSDLERVLAAEVLFRCDEGFPPEGFEATVGEVYAGALRLTGEMELPANDWGFLYDDDDVSEASAPLAAHLLRAGDAAVPFLMPLLDDEGRFLYEGSQEATLGGSLRYRVKDAAAYFLGRLRGVEVPLREDTGDRDAEIASLRAALT